MEKLIRFVRLHLGDGNEEVGRKEIDKPWIEALKILFQYEPSTRASSRASWSETSRRWRCCISTCIFA
jgi:hypothetical protein